MSATPTTYRPSRSTLELVQTLLWSSTDGDEPLDANYGASDIDASCLQRLEAEYDAFIEAADAALWDAIQSGAMPTWFDPEHHGLWSFGPSHDYALEHDYIMTRNGHGAGFWDGDWAEPMAAILDDLAQRLPEIEPYVGDDGTVYISGWES